MSLLWLPCKVGAPSTNTLKISDYEYMFILRMFIVWTLGSCNRFGCQHDFHFKFLYLFEYWGKKKRKTCNTHGLSLQPGNCFWVHVVATCMPNTLTSWFEVLLSNVYSMPVTLGPCAIVLASVAPHVGPGKWPL